MRSISCELLSEQLYYSAPGTTPLKRTVLT